MTQGVNPELRVLINKESPLLYGRDQTRYKLTKEE